MMGSTKLVEVLNRLSQDPKVVSATLDLGLRRLILEVRLPDLLPLLESAADEYRAAGWEVRVSSEGDSPVLEVRCPSGEVGRVASLAERRGDSTPEAVVPEGSGGGEVVVKVEPAGASVEEVAAGEAMDALRRAGLPWADRLPVELESVSVDASVPVFIPTAAGRTKGLIASISVCLPPSGGGVRA